MLSSQSPLFSTRTLSTLFLVSMFFASFVLLGILWFAVGAALLVYLLGREGTKKTWLLLLCGVAINYLLGALFSGFDFLNPTHAVYPLLVLALALPLLVARRRGISRTATIIAMTVSVLAVLVAYLATALLWRHGTQAWVALWQYVAAVESELRALFAAVVVGEQQVFSDEVIKQTIYAVKSLLPACTVLLAMGISYLATAVYRLLCQYSGQARLLPTNPYEITVSPVTAAIYLPFAILALFFSTGSVTAFWTVTQTISLLLAPALAYCQVRRTVFRIRNRQMDSFSWICTALFVLYLLTNPLDAVRVLALFGAYRLLTLLWHRKRQP